MSSQYGREGGGGGGCARAPGVSGRPGAGGLSWECGIMVGRGHGGAARVINSVSD